MSEATQEKAVGNVKPKPIPLTVKQVRHLRQMQDSLSALQVSMNNFIAYLASEYDIPDQSWQVNIETGQWEQVRSKGTNGADPRTE